MAASSTSCLTNEIATADSSHWLSRREAALRLLRVPQYAGISVRLSRPHHRQASNLQCGRLSIALRAQ